MDFNVGNVRYGGLRNVGASGTVSAAADVRGAKDGGRGSSCREEELLATGSSVRRTVVSASCCACCDRRYRTPIMKPPGALSTNQKGTRPETPSAASSSHAACDLQRPQPSAEAESPLQPIVHQGSRERRIPADLVQNTAEYLGRVASLLSFRGVSTEWQGAVSDAVGYLNGRCWNRFELGEFEGSLWTSLRVDDAIVVARCAVLCLRSRLETVEWIDIECLPLQLLGKNNTTLTALNMDVGEFVGWAHLRELRGLKRLQLNLEVLDLPLTNLKGLRGLVALRELSLSNTAVTNAHFAGLGQLLARLHKLDLSGCKQLKAISNLAPCVSLRELNLADSRVEDLQGLHKLVALETLNVKCIPARDWSVVQQCPRLAHLTAGVDDDGLFSADEVQELVDSVAHCLVKWNGLNPRREMEEGLPSFLRCAVLREVDLSNGNVENGSIRYLAEIPALEVLHLGGNPVDDVSALAGCRALRDLSLSYTVVTDKGIAGLQEIVTLQNLDLSRGFALTSVTNLRHCTALRELNLEGTPITNAGIEGLEHIATLTTLNLGGCESLTSVSTLRHSPSLRELDISYTEVTGAGIVGLEEIGTLERLDASSCQTLDDVTSLRRCRALRILNLGHTSVTDASMAALACVATLATLDLSGCQQIRDVSSLSESVSLRELDLTYTDVDNTGIAGLECIPTLTSLRLTSCQRITDVTKLIRSKSLRRLELSRSPVTEAGIMGIETAPALEFIELHHCCEIADGKGVARRAAECAVALNALRHRRGRGSWWC
jgi:Leucine-rich repeat (LRR) protein